MMLRWLAIGSPFDKWYFWVGAALFSLLIGLLVFFLVRPKKTLIRPIEDSAIESMIRSLGGITNLVDAAKDGARLRFTVKNVDACDLNALRDGGAMGIFITGNMVKFMLTSDSDRLVEQINQVKRGDSQ